MSRTVRSGRAAAALAAVLALVACADAGGAAEQPAPIASATSAPEPSASSVTGAPAPTSGGDERTFESHDGAVRFDLPDGWSVDDGSGMQDGGEMHDGRQGWLNDLRVRDAEGDLMLWHRESFSSDLADCREVVAYPLEIPVDPYAPQLQAQIEEQHGASAGTALILAEVVEASMWDAGAPAGTWSVKMGLMGRIAAEEGCSGLTEVLRLGSRVASVSVVGDALTPTGEPDTTIDFPSEQSARDWLSSDEASSVIDMLASMHFSGAPVLEAAP